MFLILEVKNFIKIIQYFNIFLDLQVNNDYYFSEELDNQAHFISTFWRILLRSNRQRLNAPGLTSSKEVFIREMECFI